MQMVQFVTEAIKQIPVDCFLFVRTTLNRPDTLCDKSETIITKLLTVHDNYQ